MSNIGNLAQSCLGTLSDGKKWTSTLSPTGGEETGVFCHQLSPVGNFPASPACKGQHTRGSLRQNVTDACSEKPLVSLVMGYVRGTSGVCSEDRQASRYMELQRQIIQCKQKMNNMISDRDKCHEENEAMWCDSNWMWVLWFKLCSHVFWNPNPQYLRVWLYLEIESLQRSSS